VPWLACLLEVLPYLPLNSFRDYDDMKKFLILSIGLLILLLTGCGGGGSGDGTTLENGTTDSGGTSESTSENVSSRAKDKRPNIIIVFTDDQGYADLGSQKILNDIYTPNLDRLAEGGVRMTSGYVTAPQCSPSRAGLLTGRYQQRFGFDSISDGPLPLDQITIADRLAREGYATGMVGKWHLEPNAATKEFNDTNLPVGTTNIPWAVRLPYLPHNRGFQDIFSGAMSPYLASYSPEGKPFAEGLRYITDGRFRVDVQTEAAVQFVDRHKDQPFFLYLAYFAPHVPLDATDEYLARFSGDMPEQRQYALAMISAIDDGVGALLEKLAMEGLAENTMIFFISDNGAPLRDLSMGTLEESLTWDGSLNTPLNGEKGMLLEGGIRVPFLLWWPNRISGGRIVDEPVTSLDVLPTVLAAAGMQPDNSLDGIDLLPILTGDSEWPDRSLYWRFWNQAAVRSGPWKYLSLSDGGRFLFDLESDPVEEINLIDQYPNIAASLADDLETWSRNLQPAGTPVSGPLNRSEKAKYGFYLHWFDETATTASQMFPSDGDILKQGNAYDLTWASVSGADSYNLFYFDSDVTPHFIASVGNVTSYNWTVPEGAGAGSGKRFRVTSFVDGVKQNVVWQEGTFSIAP
jgi:arylsulfatase A-like enzyme